MNHPFSRKIVAFAVRYDRPVIVLENLTHIRERVRQQRKQNLLLHSGAFNVVMFSNPNGTAAPSVGPNVAISSRPISMPH